MGGGKGLESYDTAGVGMGDETMSNDKHRNIKGKTFKTWQELWHSMTDRDFDEVYALHKENERLRSLGMYRNRRLKEARNLINRFIYRQKLCQVEKPFVFTRDKYAKPLSEPKNTQQIWENLTNMDYELIYQLHCQYHKGRHNEQTRMAESLIWKFRQHCKLASLNYPKRNVTNGFRQSENHPWRNEIQKICSKI